MTKQINERVTITDVIRDHSDIYARNHACIRDYHHFDMGYTLEIVVYVKDIKESYTHYVPICDLPAAQLPFEVIDNIVQQHIGQTHYWMDVYSVSDAEKFIKS